MWSNRKFAITAVGSWRRCVVERGDAESRPASSTATVADVPLGDDELPAKGTEVTNGFGLSRRGVKRVLSVAVPEVSSVVSRYAGKPLEPITPTRRARECARTVSGGMSLAGVARSGLGRRPAIPARVTIPLPRRRRRLLEHGVSATAR